MSGSYNSKGLYYGYDKNHKERQAEDYYSTPTEEVTNILEAIGLDFHNQTILEPCCGGGHMVQGILNYSGSSVTTSIYATDIKDRGFKTDFNNVTIKTGKDQDILLDSYKENLPDIDYVIMNPPFSLIVPFTLESLKIAKKGVVMFARIQFLETEKRYQTILKDNPPNDVYVYVDRVACYKNGDLSKKLNSTQAYIWAYWDLTKNSNKTELHFLRRANKNKI